MDETVAYILSGKHPHENFPAHSMLDMYDKMPIFIPVEIVEDAVKLVMRKLSGSSCPGGMESEALQGGF